MPRAAASQKTPAQAQQDAIMDAEGLDNFELPKALVTRIAKSAVPPNAKFSKDTVLALTRGSSVFINYLAAAAQDVAHSKSHKNIAASDVLKALETIEMPELVEVLNQELEAYRQEQKPGNKGKSKAAARAKDTSSEKTAAPVDPQTGLHPSFVPQVASYDPAAGGDGVSSVNEVAEDEEMYEEGDLEETQTFEADETLADEEVDELEEEGIILTTAAGQAT